MVLILVAINRIIFLNRVICHRSSFCYVSREHTLEYLRCAFVGVVPHSPGPPGPAQERARLLPETPPELVQCVIGGCGNLKIAFFVPFMLITIFFMVSVASATPNAHSGDGKRLLEITLKMRRSPVQRPGRVGRYLRFEIRSVVLFTSLILVVEIVVYFPVLEADQAHRGPPAHPIVMRGRGAAMLRAIDMARSSCILMGRAGLCFLSPVFCRVGARCPASR